jgi:hypothetical protein
MGSDALSYPAFIPLENGAPAGLGTGNPSSALGLVPSTVQGFVHIYIKAGCGMPPRRS